MDDESLTGRLYLLWSEESRHKGRIRLRQRRRVFQVRGITSEEMTRPVLLVLCCCEELLSMDIHCYF